MSDRVESRPRGGANEQRTKSDKRARARAAAAERAAAARRRRNAQLGMVGGLVAVVVLVGLFFVVNRDDDQKPAAGATTPSAPPAASARPTGGATPQAFPPVPEGADPALRAKPTVTKGTGELSKLVVTTLVDGKGPVVQNGQTIVVNYVGVSFRTGEEFDASWKRSQPFSFPLGQGRVIAGWDQGLAGAKVGSRLQLDIPANLAYGDSNGSGPSGPLRFVVDVLGVR